MQLESMNNRSASSTLASVLKMPSQTPRSAQRTNRL